ncbi:MAG: carbohydrate ABC transporter permease [Candidatus Sumerlaeaceae bacterium]
MTPAKRSAHTDLVQPRSLIIGFLAPAVLLYLLFFVYPVAQAMVYSLYRGSPLTGNFHWVGLRNFYRLLFEDDIFWRCVRHNLAFVFVGGALTLLLGLTIALALAKIDAGRSAFRLIYLFPHVMSGVAVTILWSFIFNPSFGLFNGMLRNVGLHTWTRAWLGEPYTTMPTLIVIHVWMSVGFYVVLFYAGLMRIPAEYQEAARIDGASAFAEFRHVTLPLLMEVTRISTIYAAISGLSVFGLVFLINEGNVNKYDEVLMTYLYDQGFKQGNFGYGSAIAVVSLVLVLVLAWLINRLFAGHEVQM